MPAQMIVHETRDEKVAVVVARLAAKRQWDAGVRAGLLKQLGTRLAIYKAVRVADVDQNDQAGSGDNSEHTGADVPAVKATRTSLSPPISALKVLSFNISTWLGAAFLVLGLTPVFSVKNLLKLSKSLPPL